MTNPTLVKVMAERIISGGINPKTGQIYTIEDVTNEEYKTAVIAYIAAQ